MRLEQLQRQHLWQSQRAHDAQFQLDQQQPRSQSLSFQ